MSQVQNEDIAFYVDLDEPPQDVLDWARENINEREEERAMKLHELREMIFERGDIMTPRTDDAFLLRFLRGRSFRVEATYKLLVNYYNLKENNPEIHENIDPLTVRFMGDDEILQILPYREQTGRRIMIYRLGNWNPSKNTITELFTGTLITAELGILEQRAQILGGHCIFDMEGISLSHVWQVTPRVAGVVLELMGTSIPLKIHALHIIFESWVFDAMFNIFKPLLNERMRNKIFFHGNDVESLHNHIDPKYLPTRYGGVRPHFRYNKWVESCRTQPRIINELRRCGYVFSEKSLTTRFDKSEDEDSNDEKK